MSGGVGGDRWGSPTGPYPDRAPGMARSAETGADNREAKAEREVTWG